MQAPATAPTSLIAVIQEALQEQSDLDQRALAGLVGCSQPTISRYKRGKVQNGRADHALKLAQALGIDLVKVFAGSQ